MKKHLNRAITVLKKPLSMMVILIIAVGLFLPLYLLVGMHISEFLHVSIGNNEHWLAFYGSYLGSAVAVGGSVYVLQKQINYNSKVDAERRNEKRVSDNLKIIENISKEVLEDNKKLVMLQSKLEKKDQKSLGKCMFNSTEIIPFTRSIAKNWESSVQVQLVMSYNEIIRSINKDKNDKDQYFEAINNTSKEFNTHIEKLMRDKTSTISETDSNMIVEKAQKFMDSVNNMKDYINMLYINHEYVEKDI